MGESKGSLIIRRLGPDEVAALESLASRTNSDEPAPDFEQSLIVVAELDGRIVGTITAERSWNVSNFWVEVSQRGGEVARRLAETIAAMNDEGLTEFLCTTNPHVEAIAYRMKFIPIRGTLWRRNLKKF